MLGALEIATTEEEVAKSYEVGLASLQEQLKNRNAESIMDLVSDISEALEDSRAASDALGSLAEDDDEELEKELEALLKEDLDDTVCEDLNRLSVAQVKMSFFESFNSLT